MISSVSSTQTRSLRVQSDLFALAEMSLSFILLNDLIKLELGQLNNDNTKTSLALHLRSISTRLSTLDLEVWIGIR